MLSMFSLKVGEKEKEPYDAFLLLGFAFKQSFGTANHRNTVTVLAAAHEFFSDSK